MSKKNKVVENKAQTGTDITQLPIKNAMTNHVKNTATQTTGLNQEKVSRDDLFPSDGDNMTQ